MPLYKPSILSDWTSPGEFYWKEPSQPITDDFNSNANTGQENMPQTREDTAGAWISALQNSSDEDDTGKTYKNQDLKPNYALRGNFPDNEYATIFYRPVGQEQPSQNLDDNQNNTVQVRKNRIEVKYDYLKNLSEDNLKDTDLKFLNSFSIENVFNTTNIDYENNIKNVTHDKLLPFLDYLLYAKYLFKENSFDPKLDPVFKKLHNNKDFFQNFKSDHKFLKTGIIDNLLLENLNQSFQEKRYFPFYNIINMNFYKESEYVNLLEKYNLNNEFLNYMSFVTDEFDNKNPLAETFLNKTKYEIYANNNKEDLTISLNEFFSMLKSKRKDEPHSYSNFLNESEDSSIFYTSNFKKREKNLTYYRIFGDLLEKATKKDSISMSGEIVGFQVQKLINNIPVSSQYFLNNNRMDTFTYVDTQVKYNEENQYIIYGFIMVYLLDSGNLIYPTITRIKLNNELLTSSVKDLPPVAPFFDVFINRNEKNTITFLLNNASGRVREHFIPLDGSAPSEEMIDFQNDDFIKQIELFRLDKEPLSYKDFGNAQKFTTNTITKKIDNIISPNKTYYFTLRLIDVHNQVSNPTYVVKIKLVQEEGYEYLEVIPYASYKKEKSVDNFYKFIDWYLLNDEDIRNKNEEISKLFKKYIQIKPSETQLLVDNLKSILPQSIYKVAQDIQNSYDFEIHGVENGESGNALNNQIMSIFEKKYKLRIKSKNSGKIVDVNFRYKLKKEN